MSDNSTMTVMTICLAIAGLCVVCALIILEVRLNRIRTQVDRVADSVLKLEMRESVREIEMKSMKTELSRLNREVQQRGTVTNRRPGM